MYADYDGNENAQAVLEGLREEYIIYSLLRKKLDKQKNIDQKE
jgi:hypothetical protein